MACSNSSSWNTWGSPSWATEPERRQALDGCAYTAEEFQEHYGRFWENMWRDAADTSTQTHWDADDDHGAWYADGGTRGHDAWDDDDGHDAWYRNRGNVSQLAIDAVRLDQSMLTDVRQQEAARGPPRSLHSIARAALNQISQSLTYNDDNLDDWFDWIPYVAAHAHCDRIIGPGITHAVARFLPNTRDPNRGGAPRLDFCFYRTDGTMCRVHPGTKPKYDAKLIFE